MTADASECNGGGGGRTKAEAMAGELVQPLGSEGHRKQLDSAGGTISDGLSDGKGDRPDHRDLESDPPGEGAGDAEDAAVAVVVDDEKEVVRQEGNALSEEVGMETNGEGETGDAKEGSKELILENVRDHHEESATVVATDGVTPENLDMAVETKTAGSDFGEMVEAKPSGNVEVDEVKKASSDAQGEKIELFSKAGKELVKQNGHCNQLHEMDGEVNNSQCVENGDASEAERDVKREPLSCDSVEEQLEVATAAQGLYEKEADLIAELKQEQEIEVTSIEVDHGRESESSHVPVDKRSGVHQVERESEGHQVNIVSAVVDEAGLEVYPGRELESTHNAADVKSEIDQQGGPESEVGHMGLVPVVADQGCFVVHYVRESEPSHDAADDKSKIDQQVELESEEHQVDLVPFVPDGECLEVYHPRESESSHDTTDVNSEIDQHVQSGSEEHQVNMLSAIGDKGSQGCEIVGVEAEQQEDLKSADDLNIDTALTELDHQEELESERKGKLNETVITIADDQIEQEVTAEEDVNQNVDIAVIEFVHQVESELGKEGQLTETVMTDAGGQLEHKQEPPTEPVAGSEQVLPEQVVPHAEKESLNFVRPVNYLQEIEPAAESELQQRHAIFVDSPSNIAEVAPIAESEEKLKLKNILIATENETACTEQVKIRLGDMVHDVSSGKFNNGYTHVPDTNLEGLVESNENHEMKPTSNGVTLEKDAESDPGSSDVVYDSDVGVVGEVATVIDVNRVGKDISDENGIHNEMCPLDLEGFPGKDAEPSHVDIDSSADASSKDVNEIEIRYPESEQSYSQSSVSNVTQYYYGNQFIKFGEIVANLDEAHLPKQGPFFIIRVPRFTGDELWANIQHAQDDVDKKTTIRDLINKEVQKQKAICSRVSGELADAGFIELETRRMFEAKRAELNYVASTVTMLSNARSLGEIDTKIKEMEFNHQHVTVPLKEEKKYMQELKQLKRHREDISSFMGSKNEIDKALKDEDSIDQKLKDLKKELDSLRSRLAQDESKAIDARKKYDDEEKVLIDLRKQYDAANEIRQNAFSHLQHLKKESYEKSRYFHKYKNDQMTAKSYAYSGDITGLWLHCSSQVEEFMNMWNNDDEFRKQYVDCNKNSVLRRLKTLDARSLGPDENPTVHIDMNKPLSTNLVSAKVDQPGIPLALEDKKETLKEELPPASQAVQKSQPAKLRKSKAATSKATKDSRESLIPVMEVIENNEKAQGMTKEEDELVRKAEELARKEKELKKEKEASELKERLKVEQRVKAKEAEERKKKQADRAQARAEYRAQKEAELKEKKRAKKERKKGSTVVDAKPIDDKEVTVPTAENNAVGTFQEQQPEAQAASSSKRTSRSAVAAKQYNRVQPVPLPLRNRGKRKIGAWMWAILTAMLVIVLFLAGNYISTSTFSLLGFRF